MKCPKCGAPLKDDNLFCEVCGEEINIVPEYDPDTDLFVDLDGVFDHTKEIDTTEVKKQKKKPQVNREYVENRHVSKRKMIDVDDDYDDEDPSEVSAIKDLILSVADFWNRSLLSKIFFIIIVLLLITGIISFGILIKNISKKQSIDYLVGQAESAARNKNYEAAIEYYEKAIEKDPNNTEIKFAISNCYLADDQDNNAIFILKEIARDNPDLATDTYERIYNIYYENSDWKGINDLLLSCDDPVIVAKFQEYLCRKPDFSYDEGEYDDILYLEISSGMNGYIYYTMDGSDPTEESILYTEPVYLESGDYDIKAIFVNEYGVISEISEAKYTIDVKIPLAPMVSIESGSYNVPITIKVESDINCQTYYVLYRPRDNEESRVDPDMNSTLYEYPLLMPMGPSEFRFISYSEEGIPSTVITRKYNITIPDATVSLVDAANIATVYRYSLGGLTDTDGHISTANGKFEYIIEDAVNLKGTIYYVINEYYVDTSNGNKRTLTGLRYAVNTKDPNDYGSLEINAKGDFYIIKERSVNLDY
ncbi:MAG: chitobiase/beta-hexosaminidase C-terminal domain-containing protein [Lachnospiraceae bacterium]|nr:chitobiase/beta-hexosaminidase C-terminal domain-containing protein [Lachnospiraceae bacterium]